MGFGPLLQVTSMSIALGSCVGLSAIPLEGVAAVIWAGAELMALVIPVIRLQFAPPPVMVVAQVDCKVDWKAEFAI